MLAISGVVTKSFPAHAWALRTRSDGLRSATAAPGAAGVVTADPYPVAHEGTLDIGRAPSFGAPRHIAGHGAVAVDQQRALTDHGTPGLTREDSFSRGGPGRRTLDSRVSGK